MTALATAVVDRSEWDKRSAASRKGWANTTARKKASRSGKKAWANASPERRAQRIAATTEALHRPEVVKKLEAAQALLSANPDVRAHKSAGRKKAWRTPAGLKERKRARARKTKEWEDPEKAKRMREAMKSPHPEAHENRSAAMTEVSSRPEVAKGRSERLKAWWAQATPEERTQRIAAMHAADSLLEVKERRIVSLKKALANPVSKAKRSALSTAMWANPESRKRMEEGRLKAARRLVGGGRKATKTDIWRNASGLRKQFPSMSWPEIARRVDPGDYLKSGPRKAGEKMRVGVRSYEQEI